MRGAVLRGPGRIEITDLPMPVCEPNEVLVKVEAVGLCGSDGAMYAGRWTFPSPFVIGHEGFGRIVAVGTDVGDRIVGSLVVVEPNIVCGRCAACLKGTSSICSQKRSLGVGSDGLCAEFARVPAAFAWPLAESVRPDDAVCIEPLAVALAALREGGVHPGEHVTVFGAGAQGLLLTLALAARGCPPHVVDPQPVRLELARELGARSTSTEAPEGPLSDRVFETSGTAGALTAAIAVAGPGATVVLIGFGHEPIAIDTVRVVRQRLRIHGSIIYEHPVDFRSTIDVVTSGALHPGAVLKRAYALADADQALRAAPTSPGKSWIAVNPRREAA